VPPLTHCRFGVWGGRANIHSTQELARKTSNEFHDDQLKRKRSNSMTSIVRTAASEEGSVRGVRSQQLQRERSNSVTSIVRTAASEEGSVRGRSRRASNSSSLQPSRLWVEKGSFWTSLELTDQSTTLGNSSQHRIHQLKVRRLRRTCGRGAHRSTPVHHARQLENVTLTEGVL
jgi:hypothetical protein